MAFGSLFMAAGKRYAEMNSPNAPARDPQVPGELHQHLPAVRLDDVGHRGGGLLRAVGVRARPRQGRLVRGVDRPFTIAILRYAVDVDGGMAGEPEDIALGDRVLQVLFLALIGTVGVAVFLG